MRALAKVMLFAAAAVCAVTVGAAGPAHASTVKCAQQPLRTEAPDILIVTCVEAAGDQRRSESTVINGSDQFIRLTEMGALISHPAYGLTDCGASRLEPGAQVVCISPWVTKQPLSASHVAAYSLVRVIEAQGRSTSTVGILHTYF